MTERPGREPARGTSEDTAAEIYVDFATAIKQEGQQIREFIEHLVTDTSKQQSTGFEKALTKAMLPQTTQLNQVQNTLSDITSRVNGFLASRRLPAQVPSPPVDPSNLYASFLSQIPRMDLAKLTQQLLDRDLRDPMLLLSEMALLEAWEEAAMNLLKEINRQPAGRKRATERITVQLLLVKLRDAHRKYVLTANMVVTQP